MIILPKKKLILINFQKFLIDMNFKNELMKYEMFSSYLREMKIVDFLKGVF